MYPDATHTPDESSLTKVGLVALSSSTSVNKSLAFIVVHSFAVGISDFIWEPSHFRERFLFGIVALDDQIYFLVTNKMNSTMEGRSPMARIDFRVLENLYTIARAQQLR